MLKYKKEEIWLYQKEKDLEKVNLLKEKRAYEEEQEDKDLIPLFYC